MKETKSVFKAPQSKVRSVDVKAVAHFKHKPKRNPFLKTATQLKRPSITVFNCNEY